MSELRVDRIKHINAGSNTPFLQLDSTGNVNHTGTMTVGTLRTDNLQDGSGNNLLSGGIVQVVQRTSQSYGEFGNTAYGNNINNLTAIGDWYIDITTQRANSRILIQWKTKMYGPNSQHQYVDLRRRIGSGGFTSLIAENRTDGTIDTFAGIHWQNGNGAFEGDYFSQFIDTPNQSAGTTLRYQQYLGGWAAGTIDFGGWDANNNQNARGLIVMTAWEIGS